MKDMTMTDLTQAGFLRAKTVLDKSLQRVGNLADDARAASRECCGIDELDARDDFGILSAKLRGAEALLEEARAIAGRISVPDRITRDGGT